MKGFLWDLLNKSGFALKLVSHKNLSDWSN